ncbi:hypothetical protein PILCRDRAFT_150688 [Piloderma croceum F 1598]|uniref:Secreted protein n=1 Tax=Piloderma croceum (strain F 1598) TaxID=765440 RepID=A0A0C3GJL4_PILCF|nr:hypothetical protein PILCRDRAFT_150688 [Piloderma croceum F 1598]
MWTWQLLLCMQQMAPLALYTVATCQSFSIVARSCLLPTHQYSFESCLTGPFLETNTPIVHIHSLLYHFDQVFTPTVLTPTFLKIGPQKYL